MPETNPDIPAPEQPKEPNVPNEPVIPGKPSPNEDQNLSGHESEANPGQLGNNTEIDFDPSGPSTEPGLPH